MQQHGCVVHKRQPVRYHNDAHRSEAVVAGAATAAAESVERRRCDRVK